MVCYCMIPAQNNYLECPMDYEFSLLPKVLLFSDQVMTGIKLLLKNLL